MKHHHSNGQNFAPNWSKSSTITQHHRTVHKFSRCYLYKSRRSRVFIFCTCHLIYVLNNGFDLTPVNLAQLKILGWYVPCHHPRVKSILVSSLTSPYKSPPSVLLHPFHWSSFFSFFFFEELSKEKKIRKKN